MEQYTFNIAGGVARNPLVRLAQPVTAQIATGEHIAIVGPNGGGKSLFVDTLLGKYPLREGTLDYDFSPSSTRTVYDNVKYIAFRDTYGAADANYYYQQRWNAHDQEDAPTVREMLGEIKDERLKEELFELFHIEPLLDKKIILLSSGELRKFQLTKTLLTAPRSHSLLRHKVIRLYAVAVRPGLRPHRSHKMKPDKPPFPFSEARAGLLPESHG